MRTYVHPLLVSVLLLLQLRAILALRVEGSSIVDDSGAIVKLKGINWFGFNNGGTMVDGLWSGNALASDFATVVLRQKLLGFNAVRLPFSFKDFALNPRSFVSDNCPLPTPEQIAASVTPPGTSPPGPAPALPFPPPRQAGKCNDYLPSTSTMDRFLYVAKFYADNGFYVLVDNHLREDQTALSDPVGWVQKWANLASKLAADPSTRSRLMIDILNEPDNYGVRWEASSGKPALKDLYLNAMDAIEAVAPGLLFFIEGTGQGSLYCNWGDGTCTIPSLISSLGLSNPNPFFTALMSKPYKSRTVISPHVYPPSVTYNYNNVTGSGLYYRLSTSFGSKMLNPGYCAGTNCQKFAIAVGEVGSLFQDSADLVTMSDIASYMNNQGAAADGKHQAIDNWFYWCWNPNSGDTGGVVDDSWNSVVWKRIEWMQTIGLKPWYTTGGGGPSPVPSPSPSLLLLPSPSPVPSPTPTPSPSPSPTPVPSPSPSPSPIPTPSTSPTPTPTPSPSPSPTASPRPPPPATKASCQVRYVIDKPSRDSSTGLYTTSVNLFVTSTGGKAVIPVPWKMVVKNTKYKSIGATWNWAVIMLAGGGGFTATASLDWQVLYLKGPAVNVGYMVTGYSATLAPKTATLNGVACKLVV